MTDTHQVRIDSFHELPEIVIRTDLRLDNSAFDVAAHVIECDEIRRVHHRQCDRVVHVRDRHYFMKQAELLGQQSNDAWVELAPEEVDIFDTDLLGRIFEPFRHNPG